MVSWRLGQPVRAPSHVLIIIFYIYIFFPCSVAFESDTANEMALSRPFKENRCELPSCTPSSLFRAIDGETYLALSQNAIALQAPQHFRPSQLQANCDCWFARQSVSSVISFSTPGTAGSPLHPVISSIAWTHWR